jgi:hypothetical protein
MAVGDFPTRDDLYAEVNREYRSRLPTAPERLSRTAPEHEWLREQWLDIRDEVLNKWVNGLYWERFPDGPPTLDPENPDHNYYVNGWIEIRDAIMDNSPLPPVDDDNVDPPDVLSQVSYDIYASLNANWHEIPPEHQDDLRLFASDGPEEVRQAWEAGLITHDRLDGWECEPLIIMTAEWNVLAKISAWWEDGLVHAYLAVAAKHPE